LYDGTTILFGLSGVAVREVDVAADGARTVHVVTADSGGAACPVCGVVSRSVRQHRVTRPKDLPYGEAPLSVRWHKTQYRCRELRCPRKAFTESIPEVPAGARVTGRLRRHAARTVGAGQSVAAAVAGLPISWPVAHDAFVVHADGLLVEPAAPAVLGIDETRRGRPRWQREAAGGWRRLERFETNFVDLTGDGGLLGQTAGRTGTAVVAWLDARGQAWKDAVQVVAMDPCAGYRAAVHRALPHVRIVVDHFHLVRLANQVVTEVRQRVAREQLGRRGRRYDPAWVNRRLLLRAGDRLSTRALARLADTLRLDDPTEEIAAAWAVKELLRQLLAARDRHTIAHRLHRFYQAVTLVDLPEATRLAETIDAWWPEILGFLETGITNGRTEGTNRLVKDAARIAFGFRSLDNQRRRVRFHCTRQSRRTTRVDGAQPPQL
jgi:transposase